jgi:hypothetical protein
MVYNPFIPPKDDIGSSLGYLRHYIGKEGIGRIILDFGLNETAYQEGPMPEHLHYLADEFRNRLRRIVERRPGRLPGEIIRADVSLVDYLKRCELEKKVFDLPDQSSSLGEVLGWVIKVNGVGHKHFENPTTHSLRRQMFDFSDKVARTSLAIIELSDLQRPKDHQLQYEYLRGYLPQYFNKKP